MLAAKTLVPVLGVPVAATQLNGMDSLLSIVQMPKGVPVGTLAIGKAGSRERRAACGGDSGHDRRCALRTAGAWRAARTQEVLDQKLDQELARSYRGERRFSQTKHETSIVRPGGLLAILGGGQLGRMMAMAARTMGYRVRVMDPEAGCPASFVVDETIVGRWDDVAAARRLATGADAVTLEIEQIGVDALSEVARIAPLRPGVEPIRIIQDKTLQKTWLADAGFPVGRFSRGAQRGGTARRRCAALGGRVFLKIGRGGYDGRGQARIGLDGPATEEAIAAGVEGYWRAACSRRAGARSGVRNQRDGCAQSCGRSAQLSRRAQSSRKSDTGVERVACRCACRDGEASRSTGRRNHRASSASRVALRGDIRDSRRGIAGE